MVGGTELAAEMACPWEKEMPAETGQSVDLATEVQVGGYCTVVGIETSAETVEACDGIGISLECDVMGGIMSGP